MIIVLILPFSTLLMSTYKIHELNAWLDIVKGVKSLLQNLIIPFNYRPHPCACICLWPEIGNPRPLNKLLTTHHTISNVYMYTCVQTLVMKYEPRCAKIAFCLASLRILFSSAIWPAYRSFKCISSLFLSSMTLRHPSSTLIKSLRYDCVLIGTAS